MCDGVLVCSLLCVMLLRHAVLVHGSCVIAVADLVLPGITGCPFSYMYARLGCCRLVCRSLVLRLTSLLIVVQHPAITKQHYVLSQRSGNQSYTLYH